MTTGIAGVTVTYNVKVDPAFPLARKLEYASHVPADATPGSPTADEAALLAAVTGPFF